MVIPFYKALENPQRTLDLKLDKGQLDYWSDNKNIYNDWVEEFKFIENDLDCLDEYERQEYLFKRIILSENDLNIRDRIRNIIPASQLSKMSPKERTATIKVLNQLVNPKAGNDIIVKLELLASYISPTGEIIGVTSSHQKNNFNHPYFHGKYLLENYKIGDVKKHSSNLRIVNQDSFIEELNVLLRWRTIYDLMKVKEDEYIEYNSKLSIPEKIIKILKTQKNHLTLLDEFIIERNQLYKKYMTLKKSNIVNSDDINEYFHFIGSRRVRHILFEGEENNLWLPPSTDYSEEIRQNIIGLISGHIAILDSFIEIAQSVTNSIVDFENLFIDMNDFLVQMAGFNKIETQISKTLTTSNLNINESTYNYQIMNWNVVQLPKYRVNKNKGIIEKVEVNEYDMIHNSPLEKEYEKEIRLIKTKVPIQERCRYFR